MTQQTQTKQLPKGWKAVKLQEVLDYEQPNEYIVNSEILDEETLIPVLTANKGFIKGYTKETKGIFKEVPVIIFDDFTTDTKFVNFPFKVKSSAMKILKLKDKEASLKYIFYQMQTIDVRTTTHKRYYLSEYQNLDFLFPTDKNQKISFEKQEEVVSAIETQFTRLDEAVKNLKDVKTKLEVYRKSVLKKVFEKKEGWEEKKISELCEIKGGKRVPKGEKFSEIKTKYPYLRVTDFAKYSINQENLCYISEETFKKISRYIIYDNEVFISIAGTIGRVGMIPQNLNGANLTENAAKLTNFNNIEPKFIMYYLASPYLEQIINFSTKSTSQPKLALFRIGSMNLKYPKSILEQQQIVSSIESKFSIINKVEQIVDESLKKAEKLQKSILKSAFEGKLVKE